MRPQRQYPRIVVVAASLAVSVAALAVAADPLVHTVAKGETLYGIARRYDVSVDALMKANEIRDATRVVAGMRLSIPGVETPGTATATPAPEAAPRAHTVKKGETLFGIARTYGLTVDAIARENGLSGSSIRVGQSLRLPAPPATKVASDTAQVTKPAEKPDARPAAKPAETPPETLLPVKPSEPIPVAAQAAKAWPVQGAVSQLQGKLRGVSIAAKPSAPILAVRSGTVVSAGPFRGFDLVAFVQAPDGLVYVYGGATALGVKVGDSVRKGSSLGRLSSDESPSAYFFVFKGADTIDPTKAPRD